VDSSAKLISGKGLWIIVYDKLASQTRFYFQLSSMFSISQGLIREKKREKEREREFKSKRVYAVYLRLTDTSDSEEG